MSAYQSYYAGSPQPTPSSPTQSSEKSVKSCYAVVYELQNRKWAVSGEGGWSEVHLCADASDNSHRILAWTVKNQNVLMNCNVTGECAYKEKSRNFHSFTDENGNRFGLGFHKSDSGLRQASHFLAATVDVIKECKKSELNGFTLASGGDAGSGSGSGMPPNMPPPNPHDYNKNKNQSNHNHNHKNSYNIHKKNSHAHTPLPPSPNLTNVNNNNNNTVPAANNYSSYDNNNNNNAVDNNYNSYNNNNNMNGNSNNNTNPSGNSSGGGPPPPPFMSGGGNGSVTGSHKSPPPARQQSPKPPPPNPFQKQQQAQAQAAAAVQQPAVSKPQPPPPSFSSATGNSNNSYTSPPSKPSQPPPQPQAAPPAFSQSTGLSQPQANYPQLQKPNSPYQSTTESVKLSPVQAAVNGDNNEQKTSQKSPMAEANLPNYHLAKNQLSSLPTQPIGPLGALKIMPPKPSKLQSGDKKIQNPEKVEHTVRVVHDKDTGQFHGLPKEWMEHLNKQFGVKPHLLPSIKLNQYQHKIPKVIVALRAKLEEANAYEQVGIFRLAPNATDNDNMKTSIDKGHMDDINSADSNVYANLLKVWFRDLPDPLLNCIDPTHIEMAQKEDDVKRVIGQFPEPQKSIFEWLCDMCCECAKHEKVNKMGPQNLAIVIGPNLFNTDNFENPMKAMTFSGKVVQFFKLAIVIRQKELGLA